jgi:hypothetical protein
MSCARCTADSTAQLRDQAAGIHQEAAPYNAFEVAPYGPLRESAVEALDDVLFIVEDWR